MSTPFVVHIIWDKNVHTRKRIYTHIMYVCKWIFVRRLWILHIFPLIPSTPDLKRAKQLDNNDIELFNSKFYLYRLQASHSYGFGYFPFNFKVILFHNNLVQYIQCNCPQGISSFIQMHTAMIHLGKWIATFCIVFFFLILFVSPN